MCVCARARSCVRAFVRVRVRVRVRMGLCVRVRACLRVFVCVARMPACLPACVPLYLCLPCARARARREDSRLGAGAGTSWDERGGHARHWIVNWEVLGNPSVREGGAGGS